MAKRFVGVTATRGLGPCWSAIDTVRIRKESQGTDHRQWVRWISCWWIAADPLRYDRRNEFKPVFSSQYSPTNILEPIALAWGMTQPPAAPIASSQSRVRVQRAIDVKTRPR